MKKQQTHCIIAAAFQEHLVKSLSLGSEIGPRNVQLSRLTQSKARKKVTAIVDTGRGSSKTKQKVKQEKHEYVLDDSPESTTLAQRMGLVRGPDPLLTESQWSDAKVKSQNRNDSSQPCVICKDSFGLHQQVILSCSHVFHRNCLEAFERFTGKRTCPLCRKERYEKRVIYEGAKRHRHHSATLIQATWRGYVVRTWYKKLRKSVPPKDPVLRKKFFEEKLSAITDRMVASCSRHIDVFLREVDSNIAASRHVFNRFTSVFCQLTDEQWTEVQLKALKRDVDECPICLNKLHITEYIASTNTTNLPSSNTKSLDAHSDAKVHPPKMLYGVRERDTAVNWTDKDDGMTAYKQTVLLSCSHMFHRVCLETFEDLVVDHARQCPVCRDSYQKLVLS